VQQASVQSDRLSELPEEQAAGEIALIYSEIRDLTGVPMVALIYRHLATIPGALPWAWGLLRPAMRFGVVQHHAWRAVEDLATTDMPSITAAALQVAGLAAAEQREIAHVLDVYNRANPVNLLAVRCLSSCIDRDAPRSPSTDAWEHWTPPEVLRGLPPMVDPSAMPPAVQELAQLLTSRTLTEAPPALWPSLYRHLAHWPNFLGYASVLLLPRFDQIDAGAAALRQRLDLTAAEIVDRLTPAPELERPSGKVATDVQSAIAQFSLRIPEMVIVGKLLRRALAEPDRSSSAPVTFTAVSSG
jgi:hypothetical protein